MTLNPTFAILAVLMGSAIVASANPADLDRDKRISLEEFEALNRKNAENQGKPYNAAGVRNTFADKDHDDDGFLSYREFSLHGSDFDGDKKISLEEFTRLHARRAARGQNPVSEAWIKETFAKRDQDGDGFLSYEEFARPLN